MKIISKWTHNKLSTRPHFSDASGDVSIKLFINLEDPSRRATMRFEDNYSREMRRIDPSQKSLSFFMTNIIDAVKLPVDGYAENVVSSFRFHDTFRKTPE